jgi:hypothetical protein
MTVSVTCDWSGVEIDDEHPYSAEEMNRLGFEAGLDDDHVIVESRYSGRDRWGQPRGRREVGHYHSPGCYKAMLRLLGDQRGWAQAQGTGPAAADTPRWSRAGDLIERKRAVSGRPSRSSSPLPWLDNMHAREKTGTGFYTSRIFDRQTADKLFFGAGLATLEEVAQLTEGQVLAIEGIGPVRLAEIVDVLAQRGLVLRTEAEEA